MIRKKAKKEVWYRFTFADGFISICRGLSAAERGHYVRQHGKLVSKIIEAEYEV